MSNVIIKIFDLLGGEVITLVNEEMEAGWYRREYNASGYSSGIYIYRMQAGNYISTKKMILIK
jgi:Secretion system C-terminal sorting domain